MIGEAHQAAVRSAAEFADQIARMLYFASGAFHAKHPTQSPAKRGAAARFARLVLPLLDELTAVPQPRVTLHLVQTLDHIAAADPKRALLIAASAVTADQAYWRELAGVHAALDLVRHIAADHREIFLGDPQSTTAVRRMLESFIRVGWDQAIELASEPDELFT
ncbi:MAG TPA: hypothetical protein VGX23_32000 [Actinocrinis sp.]|nr:hypothetical protein [Actinocrinis sp.]